MSIHHHPSKEPMPQQSLSSFQLWPLRIWPKKKAAPRSNVGTEAARTKHGQTNAPRQNKFPRHLLYGVAGFGVVFLIAMAFRPSPVPVDIGDVSQGPLHVTIDAEGKTRVQERYVVSAPVNGRLQRIDLDPGDPVQQGTVIAQLDPLPLTSQVQSAQARLQELRAELVGVETQRPKPAELTQADARLQAAIASQQAATAQVAQTRAALEQATRDRLRAQELESDGAIARQTREAAELEETRLTEALDVAQRDLEGAIATVAAAEDAIAILQAEQRDPDYLIDTYQAQIKGVEAELTNLADEARRTTITAPVTSTVLQLPEASARFVQAGDPLIELGNPADLELVIDVLSADAVQIKPGDPILVEQWGGSSILNATVTTIEPAAFTEVSALGVEEQRVNIIGTFTDPDPVALGDGYRIEAGIVIWSDDDVVQVPISALYRCGPDWCVFTVEEEDGSFWSHPQRAVPRTITLGPRNPEAAVVESGLQPGDRVILHPSDQITANRAVTPR